MERYHLAAHVTAWFVITALCFAAAIPGAHAQSPATRDGQQPHRDGTHPPVVEHPLHVRFWKADLRGFPNLRVTLSLVNNTPKQPAVTHDLGSGGPGYLFGSYADSPSGHGTIGVFDTPAAGSKGQALQPLVSLPVDMIPGSFVTVLLDEPPKGVGVPKLEVIVDDASNEKGSAASAQITVRSFVADLKDMRVTLGETLNAQFTGHGSYLQMRGLRPDVYPVRTAGNGPENKSFEWTNEADLREHSHQTLLVYPDPYGRIRPRLIVDGETQMDSQDNPEDRR